MEQSTVFVALGNLTSNGSTSFVYDVENRLVSASGAKTASLVYDPLGRLFETSGGTSGVARFLYDGDRLALEYDELGAIKWRYFFGPNVDEPLLADPGGQLNCEAGTRFLHSDHQGSIVALADCWGNRQAVNSYDEYGIPASTNIGRFQYTGQAWIPELGMYHYKARLYSPTLGRFLQVDPIGYDDQVNLYAYVGNDPVNATDPSGMCTGSRLQNSDGTCAMGDGFVSSGLSGDSTSSLGGARQNGASKTKATDVTREIIPGARQSESAFQAFKEGRYLDAAGIMLAGMGEAALAVFPVGRPAKAGQALSQGLVERIFSRLERLGGGPPARMMTTPKGAPQFIFPNGMKLRFDLKPGQYSPKQGPHINVEHAPGSSNPNIHIPVKL